MSDDDIDNMDFDLPSELVNNPATTALGSGVAPPMMPGMEQFEGMFPGMAGMMPQPKMIYRPEPPTQDQLEASKSWARVYPIYINAQRSRHQGRKIQKSSSVEKPNAIYMAEACAILGLKVLLESEKRHPKDPFTFGRLRVQLDKNHPTIKSKHDLLVAIAEKFHDVTINDPDGKMKSYIEYSLSTLSPPPPKKIEQETPLGSSAAPSSPPKETTTQAEPSSSKKKAKKEKKKIIRM